MMDPDMDAAFDKIQAAISGEVDAMVREGLLVVVPLVTKLAAVGWPVDCVRPDRVLDDRVLDVEFLAAMRQGPEYEVVMETDRQVVQARLERVILEAMRDGS